MVFELRQGASNVRCEDESEARRRRIFKVCETAGVDETRMDKETAGDKKISGSAQAHGEVRR